MVELAQLQSTRYSTRVRGRVMPCEYYSQCGRADTALYCAALHCTGRAYLGHFLCPTEAHQLYGAPVPQLDAKQSQSRLDTSMNGRLLQFSFGFGFGCPALPCQTRQTANAFSGPGFLSFALALGGRMGGRVPEHES